MRKIDFVVVAFSFELKALLLQARSLARLNASTFINEYIVLWNEGPLKKDTLQDIVAQIDTELRGSGIKWKLLPRNTFGSDKIYGAARGNISQQALKLEAARMVGTEQFCVLDSKNHLVRNLSWGDFYGPTGKLRGHSQSVGTGVFYQHLVSGLRYFGATETEIDIIVKAPIPQTTTPYMISTKICRELVSFIEKEERMPFSEAFLTVNSLTKCNEFYLYFAFLRMRCGKLEQFYDLEKRIYSTFFNRSPAGQKLIDQALTELKGGDIKFLGIHRGRKKVLGKTEKEAFSSLWVAAGLFATLQEANDYLENDTFLSPSLSPSFVWPLID